MATVLAAALVLGQCAAADSPYAVDAWSTADGLPQGSVIAITQTHDGYLWLGTINGLVRFDGNSMTKFNVNNTPGLPDNVINFLFEDSRSNLWVGTSTGKLCIFQGSDVKQFDVSSAGGKINFASEDKAGTIWFGTTAGNFLSFKEKLDLGPADFPPQFFYRIFNLRLDGKNGVVWRLQDGRVQKFRGGQLEKDFGNIPWTPVPNRVPRPIQGIDYYDENVTAICEDHEGNLVVGTHDSGVYWFDAAGGVSHIPTDKGLSQNIVLSLYCDREGNIWVGTDGDGLERIHKKNLVVIDEKAPGSPVSIAESIAEDLTGGVWTAFDRRGLTYTQTNSTANFRIGTYTNASSVFVDSRQQVWAGTRSEGLFQFVAGSFQPVAAALPVGLQIFALFQSRDGKLWVGGQNRLASFDGQDWNFYSPAEGLPSGAIRALAEDVNSNLWIGSDSAGICTLRDGKISPTNAPVTDILCLLSDSDGVLWAGTSGHGLARCEQGRWTSYSSTNGLMGDDIGYLIEDDSTNLWLGSYEGLMRAEKKSLTDLATGVSKKISCRTFLTSECSLGAQPAAIRTRGGRLLFPTIEGLVAVNPADLRPNTNPPPVVIESVLVDGLEQKSSPLSSIWPEAIVLQPENEQLEIHFTALNFSAPKGAQFGARFKYQLEGDKTWTDVGGERVAHIGRLAPGSYVFRVIACNEDGYWNDIGATITVVVEPPFWRKPWFVAAAVLGFLGVLAGTIYLISTAKLRRQLRLAQQKELIEHERARIARDLHDQLGANLTQITLLGEMAETDKEIPAEIELHAQQICVTARETTRSLDEIVWAVNPSNDTLESLANYACKYAQDYFAMAGVSYRAELPPGLPPTPILPEVRHNIFLAYKEAVNNVVKHAHATEARVKLQLEADRFILSVTDNGRGLGDISDKKLRNGMKNMRRRLADVNGEFRIAPGTEGGTVVSLTVPIGKAK